MTAANAHTLLRRVRAGDWDAAIDAGLMQWSAHVDDGLSGAERALLEAACQRLRTAWDARERFRARQARLQRREHERLLRRAASVAATSAPSCVPEPDHSAPALPAAAAAVLARARARVGVGSQ